MGPRDQVVGTCPVGDAAADVERSTAASGRGAGLRHQDAVVADADPPGLADVVAVDLVLHLDAAVVVLGLELPVRGTGAAAGADDAVPALGEREGGAGDDEGGAE